MKRFFLRNIAITFLLFNPLAGWASEGTISGGAWENEKAMLYKAIENKNLVEVERRYSDLMNQKKNGSWEYDDWPNPLVFAIRFSSKVVVDFFFKIPMANDWLKEKSKNGNTTIFTAVEFRDIRLLKKIMSFSEMENLLNEKQGNGWTPFHWAIAIGEIELVKFLLSFRQVQADLATRNKHGETILHSTIFSGNIEIVKTIFGLPEARSLIFEKDDFGRTVLQLAFTRGVHKEILPFVLSLPEALQLVSLLNEEGSFTLHEASPIAFLTVAKFLENHPEYLHLLEVKNKKGRTPLFEIFIGFEAFDISKFAKLRWFEKLLFEKDNQGRNLMHEIVIRDNLQEAILVAGLMKNPKKLFGEPDNEGTSPLGWAVQLARNHMVGALLAEGFDFENVSINHKKISAIEFLTQDPRAMNSSTHAFLLQFLLSRPAEERESSGWSRLQ